MFDSNQFFSGGAAGFYPKTIGQSLRFNDDDDAYLTRTPSVDGTNSSKFTMSMWFKKTVPVNPSGLYQVLFSFGADTNNNVLCYFTTASNTLDFWVKSSGSIICRRITNASYADPSSWYHLVVAYDNDNATTNDLAKIYINGVQVTDFSSITNTGGSTVSGTQVRHDIGAWWSTQTSHTFDGYMAEVHSIDGQALDPTSFGEFKSGVWVAKNYTGTYGTNGFYLEFDGNVNDSAGSNNWTANNIASNDYVDDSPTNNFATMNPLDKHTTVTLSDGNLKSVIANSGQGGVRGNFGMTSGKWYFECTIGSTPGLIGVANADAVLTSEYPGNDANGWTVFGFNGNKYNGSAVAYGNTWTTDDVVGVAVDMDNGKIWWAINNTWQASGNPATGANPAFSNLSGTVFAAAGAPSNTGYGLDCTWNFGQQSFTYTPPTGYEALSTANLPDPDIDPAEDDLPEDYFNTVLYTGNAAQDRTITGVGFQPDFVWIKDRTADNHHVLMDAVRGGAKQVNPSSDTSEQSNTDLTNGFASDGFIVGDNVTGTGATNINTNTYVAWNWKAGTSFTFSGETDTTNSSGSSNSKAGLSIVTYTGATTERVKHNLTLAPEMIMVKNLSGGDSWAVYHTGLSTDNFLELNHNYAQASGSNPRFLSSTHSTSVPTATYFYVRNYSGSTTNDTGDNYVAYCFHSVEGFSKFGSYKGNSNTNGPFVYTGFKPAFLIMKRAITTSTGSWAIVDSKRAEYNPETDALLANSNLKESTGYLNIDLLSNGFKLRDSGGTTNNSSSTYIYMAFAENPFKYANAR